MIPPGSQTEHLVETNGTNFSDDFLKEELGIDLDNSTDQIRPGGKPGTFPITDNSDLLITPSSNEMVQVVSRESGVNPAAPNTKLSFMLKHPAWAAAINSSGLVPIPSSKRELKEYCV